MTTQETSEQLHERAQREYRNPPQATKVTLHGVGAPKLKPYQAEVVEQIKKMETITIAVPAKVHAPEHGSKLERAVELYKQATDKSRKAIIELFVKELGMTPAGASTYQNKCKHMVGG